MTLQIGWLCLAAKRRRTYAENMAQEQTFTHGGVELRYTVLSPSEATVIYKDANGDERHVRLDPQQGGGAYRTFVPDEASEAVKALGYHLWPRP